MAMAASGERSSFALRVLLLHMADSRYSEVRLHEIAGTHGCSIREVTSRQTESWANEACAHIESALTDGWGAVVVVVSQPEARVGADTAAQLLAAGADDVIDGREATAGKTVVQSVQRLTRLLRTCQALEMQGGLVGISSAMRRARKQLASAIDDPEMPVLILGETGTGKQLAASALHRLDPSRSGAPFHAVDCGSVVDSLFGSELFGHMQGAFTGAQSSRSGAFATAGSGVLFLDEIGELSAQLQAGFLTALQERKYRPVGSDRESSIKCRIVAATNRDLPTLVAAGKFRIDLFSRLDGLRVLLPPLRERPQDIAALFRGFALRHNPALTDIDSDVVACVASTPLMGNVRELESIARHSALASLPGERIRLAHLPISILHSARDPKPMPEHAVADMVTRGMRLEEILAECSGRAVDTALRLAAGMNPSARKTEVVTLAAKQLGVSPRTIYVKLNGGDSRPDIKH